MLSPPDLLAIPQFRATRLAHRLLAEPLRLIDIGARDGVSELFLALGKMARVLAFEPDAEGFEALAADTGLSDRLAEVVLRREALGDGTKRSFHLMTKATNHSLLPTNPALVNRYTMELFRPIGCLEMETHRLDDIVALSTNAAPGFGELVKIDTQASEHLILSHAKQMLSTITTAVVAEVWFCEVYEGAPLFSEICQLLQSAGLSFYGFTSFFLRSGKRVDKRSSLGRERALYADALFLRDPLDHPPPTASQRHWDNLFIAAILTGFFDLALEVCPYVAAGDDRAALTAVINHVSAAPTEMLLAEAQAAVHRAIADPATAMVSLGQFVDRWRSTFDYGDVR